VLTKWIAGTEMPADMFTKNLPRPLFEKHTTTFCGEDEYMKSTSDYMQATVHPGILKKKSSWANQESQARKQMVNTRDARWFKSPDKLFARRPRRRPSKSHLLMAKNGPMGCLQYVLR
jgi:hypothetical protein